MPNPRPNPYPGPRSFQRGETLYGRQRETAELLDLLIAERIVLLYSPSGAGKTSLVQAALIPVLEDEGFHVLPVMRPGLLSADVAQLGELHYNRYILSLLLSLERELPEAGQTPLAELAGLTLADYLARLPAPPEEGRRGDVLIFDQFEEVLTVDPTDRDAKLAFFDQVGAALRDRNRWALFSMREEYVASLDPYLRPIPARFDKGRRYRLDLLGPDTAREAMQGPAAGQAPPAAFTDAAARKLADDLRRVQVQQPDGTTATTLGPYIEPVQLQVVCWRLWDGLAPDDVTIDLDDLAAVGDVDTALRGYYADTVAGVAERTGVRERTVREWTDRQLITEGGVRGQVLMGAEQSQGLANVAIWPLVNSHLIRAEQRRGATWFELAHDRLIAPVRADNAAWFETNLSPFQRQAALWQQQNRPDSLLLRGDALAEAERWADAHPAELEAHEKDFLAAGRKARGDLAERLVLTAGVLLKQRRDLALLLAAEATHVAATPTSRDSLLRSLQDDVHVGELALPQVSQGHSAAINRTVVSPDGKLFATGGNDNKILLWNLAERKAIGEPLLGHSQGILDLAFSPDGRILASASQDRSILLWDVATHRRAGPALCGHYRTVWGLAFSPDGRLLASSDDAGKIVIWDLWAWMPSEGGPAAAALPSGRTVLYLKGHSQLVASLAFRPQGDLLASASCDGTVGLWNVQTGRQVAKLAGHVRKVLCVAFSKDGERLASSDEGGFVFIWDVAKQQQILNWKGHSNIIFGVEFSPDGSLLASGGWDKQVVVWEAATGKKVHPPLSGHQQRISGVAFTPDGKELISADLGGTVLVWNVATGAQVSPPLVEHKVSANSVAITPDGSTLIGGCSDGSLVLWSLPAGQIQGAPLRGHRNTVSWVRVSPDGERMVSADWDGSLVIRHTSGRRPLVTLWEHKAAAFGASFSPDGRSLASCGGDGRILIWNCDDGKLLKEMMVEGGSAMMVAYQPGGSLLASAHDDGAVRLWDPVSGERAASLEGHGEAVFILAWHPAGRLLASGGRDGRVRLWDAEAQRAAREPLSMKQAHDALAEHGRLVESVKHVYPDWARQWGSNHTVSSLAFSPGGRLLASGAVSGAIALWDVESGRLLGLPLWSGSPIALDMAFTPDGSQLISAHSDGTIHRWATGDAAWRSLARRLAGRDLTPDERREYLK